MGRRQFTAEFKTKIVLEILREQKQLGELAAEHGVSPNQLRNWKKEISGEIFKGVFRKQTREGS